MFETEGFKREERVSQFIKPGIQELQITSAEYVVSNVKKTEGVKLTLEGRPQEGLNGEGAKMDATYWLSEKAWEYTKGSLCDIVDAMGTRKAFDAAGGPGQTAEGYVAKIESSLTGTFARFLIQGEEIEAKDADSNTWVKATLPLFPKVESIDVPAEKTGLTFDAEKHIVKLVVPDVKEMADAPAQADEMPF